MYILSPLVCWGRGPSGNGCLATFLTRCLPLVLKWQTLVLDLVTAKGSTTQNLLSIPMYPCNQDIVSVGGGVGRGGGGAGDLCPPTPTPPMSDLRIFLTVTLTMVEGKFEPCCYYTYGHFHLVPNHSRSERLWRGYGYGYLHDSGL